MAELRMKAQRIRVGQKYLEAGEQGKPSVRYVHVVSLDPLVVQPEVWTGKRGLDVQPYEPETLLSLPLVYDPELTECEVREVLMGRRVVDVEIVRLSGDWPQCDFDVALELDDGQKVWFRAWGYDAWGISVNVDTPLVDG